MLQSEGKDLMAPPPPLPSQTAKERSQVSFFLNAFSNCLYGPLKVRETGETLNRWIYKKPSEWLSDIIAPPATVFQMHTHVHYPTVTHTFICPVRRNSTPFPEKVAT